MCITDPFSRKSRFFDRLRFPPWNSKSRHRSRARLSRYCIFVIFSSFLPQIVASRSFTNVQKSESEYHFSSLKTSSSSENSTFSMANTLPTALVGDLEDALYFSVSLLTFVVVACHCPFRVVLRYGKLFLMFHHILRNLFTMLGWYDDFEQFFLFLQVFELEAKFASERQLDLSESSHSMYTVH